MRPSASDPNVSRLRRLASGIRRKKDLEAGLAVAERRQKMMLPREPALARYDFSSTYAPAADITGDFYDYVDLGPGRVGILLGDVSGHGIEAAIVMGMARKSLSIFARSAAGPAEALVLGNDDLLDDLDSETFFTAVYAVLAAAAGRLVIARGGHPHPVLFNPKGRPPTRAIESGGMMAGMTRGAAFRQSLDEVALDLVAGDLVFFYTDGLTEARSPSGEMFGIDRALAVIESAPKALPGDVLEAVRRSLTEFRGGREPDDDVTMIAFRRNE